MPSQAFEPIEEFAGWHRATHEGWRFTRESMHSASLIAGGVFSKDRAAVQTMVLDLISDGDLGGVMIMLDSLRDCNKTCNALMKIVKSAQTRLLIGAAEIVVEPVA